MVLLVDAFWNAPSAFWNTLALFKRQKKLGPGFDAPLGPDKLQEVEVSLEGAKYKKIPTKIYWDLSGQHTLSWKELSSGTCAETWNVLLIPLASCNTYGTLSSTYC